MSESTPKKLRLHADTLEVLEQLVEKIIETGRTDIELTINPILFQDDSAMKLLERIMDRHPKAR